MTLDNFQQCHLGQTLKKFVSSLKKMLKKFRKNICIEVYLLLSVILLFCLYIFFLHPISGLIGAALLIIWGWVIPTVIVFLLAWIFSYLITSKLQLRIIISILMSAIFGLNSNIVLIKYIFYPPVISYEIKESVKLQKGVVVNRKGFEIFNDSLVKKYLFESKVTIVTDASIGKMYFVKSKDALIDSLSNLPARPAIGNEADVLISISIVKNESTLSTEIKIINRGKEVSWLKAEKIPFVTVTGLYGREVGMENKHFFENAFDMLLHKNIYSYLISYLAYRNSLNKISEYFNKAMN